MMIDQCHQCQCQPSLSFFRGLTRDSCTMVKHSPHYPKVEGSGPASAAGTERENGEEADLENKLIRPFYAQLNNIDNDMKLKNIHPT